MYKNTNILTEDQLQSKAIRFLRFPLIVGILFIHCQAVQIVDEGASVSTPYFNFIRDLFSLVLSAVAVPLFFIMSGYLFFYNTEFTKDSYLVKIKKRVRTLLVPYLFWNCAYLLFNTVVAYVPLLASMFRGSPMSLEYAMTALWGCNTMVERVYPIAYQFWFIRDLMVMVVLSPLFYFFITRTKTYGILLIAILWGMDFNVPYIGMRGMSSVAIFFFMLGAWLSVNRKNIIIECKKLSKFSFITYPILVILDLFTINSNSTYNIYIHNVGILLGVICSFNIARSILQKKQMKNLEFWSSASFFVFAVHDPWILTQLRKVTAELCAPVNDGLLILCYFTNVILTTIIAVGVYMLIKRTVPRFTALVTGNR